MKLNSRQKKVYEACINNLPLQTVKLGNEYYYNSLAFCLIDAVFSIGVNYTSTTNTVSYFCKQIQYENRMYYDSETEPDDEYTIDNLVSDLKTNEDYGMEHLFNNRQWTSSRGGIRKAEAVFRAAQTLKSFHINTINDIRKKERRDLEEEFRRIPGQASGISYSYLLMLAGNSDQIKIDRWIKRFVNDAVGEQMDDSSIKNDLFKVCQEIKKKYPEMTPRLLDYAIWSNKKMGDRIPSRNRCRTR